MYVKKIRLSNFRNYENAEIDFDPSTNIIYGDNAQGKTNILESIYLGATTRSHRQSRDRDIIRFDNSEAHIRLELEKKGRLHKIDMHLRKNKSKVVAVDGIPIRKSAELLGILNVIFFSPEDLSIVKNGPSERRRFMDMELCQLDRAYMSDLVNYNRTLNQRNKLLKEMSGIQDIDLMLDVYDEQLLLSGMEIIKRRRSFCEELEEIVRDIHSRLSGKKESCSIEYSCDVSEDSFKSELKASREKDKKYRTTNCGPHRDDIVIYINGQEVRRFGSQGQQRCAALSLKLAEIRLMEKIIKDEPVLLLDDVLSELDSKRQAFLLESIKDIQTVITCTGLDEFIKNRFDINRKFRVVDGAIENE